MLVSISFAPILLSAKQGAHDRGRPPDGPAQSFHGLAARHRRDLLLGSVYATQTGMGAVFGTQIGMTADQIALFVAMLFAGALVFQFPIGWLSDRIDRRKLIFGASALGAASCALGWITGGSLSHLMAAAFFAGGVTTPLYALFLAYTNDFLSAEDMPAASGRAGLHVRPGRHRRSAGHRLGDAAVRPVRVLAGAGRDLRRHRALRALPHDAALDRPGGSDRELPERAAHRLDRGRGDGGRPERRSAGRAASAPCSGATPGWPRDPPDVGTRLPRRMADPRQRRNGPQVSALGL